MTTPGTLYVFLWGFNRDGEVFVDARLAIINEDKSEIRSLQGMAIRMKFCPELNSSAIRIPEGESFQMISDYVLTYNVSYDRDIIKKLKDAKVYIPDLFRVKEDNNAIDFITWSK